MIDSILTSTKDALGIPAGHTEFDNTIIMHINSVFSTLHQLGVGPSQGFMITSDTELWSTFLGGSLPQNNIRSYMYLRVRMLFDPPTTGYHMTSMQDQAKELEWRINVDREGIAWTDPDPSPDTEVLDGGSP
jgi:hypothetical protein